MRIKIGDVDIAKEIVELNHQLIRTQLILEHVVNNTPNLSSPSALDIQDIDRKALESLQKKYPNMGISKT